MQPTQKQYEQDAFLQEMDTTLAAIDSGKSRLALAATVFYPEGGGQPADEGLLTLAGETVAVTDVQIQDGIVWHAVEHIPAKAAEGCAVHGKIDWERRFDHMQQHTGEHILSGTLHRLFGAENVGFHLGAQVVRMDTSIHLTDEQLRQAETEANACIWADAPVQVLYPTPEELTHIAYRSKKELTGQVRIVDIPGGDVCACCGTHVRTAGQVGLIKIIASEHYKIGERLTVLCGKRALLEMQQMHSRQRKIGALLSAQSDQTAIAAQRLFDDYTSLKFAHFGMANQLFAALAQQTEPGKPAIHIVPGLTPDELHRLTEALCKQTDSLCAALTETEKGIGYCIGKQNGDVRPLVKTLNASFAGRGGGKPILCQGSCTETDLKTLADWLALQAEND